METKTIHVPSMLNYLNWLDEGIEGLIAGDTGIALVNMRHLRMGLRAAALADVKVETIAPPDGEG